VHIYDIVESNGKNIVNYKLCFEDSDGRNDLDQGHPLG
jgi:hypothetical protein